MSQILLHFKMWAAQRWVVSKIEAKFHTFWPPVKIRWGIGEFFGFWIILHTELHWLNVPEQVAFKLGLIVFNCLHNQVPQYLVDLCQSVSSVASRQHLRSANRGLLVVTRYRLSSYGWRAFSVAGPAIWNWLPDSMRDPAISRDSFRRSLKTFLFSAYLCT